MPQYTPETDLSWRGKPYPAGIPADIPDDLAAALGLAASDPQPEAIAPADAAHSADLATAVDRLEELRLIYQVDGWKAIKAIADPLGVKKHPDGWDSSLLLIIEREFSPAIADALAAEDAAE